MADFQPASDEYRSANLRIVLVTSGITQIEACCDELVFINGNGEMRFTVSGWAYWSFLLELYNFLNEVPLKEPKGNAYPERHWGDSRYQLLSVLQKPSGTIEFHLEPDMATNEAPDEWTFSATETAYFREQLQAVLANWPF